MTLDDKQRFNVLQYIIHHMGHVRYDCCGDPHCVICRDRIHQEANELLERIGEVLEREED